MPTYCWLKRNRRALGISLSSSRSGLAGSRQWRSGAAPEEANHLQQRDGAHELVADGDAA